MKIEHTLKKGGDLFETGLNTEGGILIKPKVSFG